MHHYRLNGAAFITTVSRSQRSMGNACEPHTPRPDVAVDRSDAR